MAINLLDLFKSQLNDDVLGSVSNLLGGDDTGAIQKGLMTAAPALLGGLMDKASTESGAKQVFDMLGDGSTLGNIAGILGAGGDKTQGFLDTGLGFVKSILGDKASGIIDMISSVAGLGNSSSSSLLSIAGSVLGGVLGKQKSSGLDLGSFVGLLSNQGSFLEKAAPAGLASLLGLGSFSGLTDKLGGLASGALGFAGNLAGGASDAGKAAFDGASKVAGSAANLAGDTAAAGGSMIKKLLPWAIGLLGLLFVFYLMKGCDGDKSAMDNIKDAATETTGAVKSATETAVDATKEAANSAGDAVKSVAGGVVDASGKMVNAFGEAIGKFFDWALPNGKKLNIPEGGFEADFLEFLKAGKLEPGKYYAFDRLYFNTGSAGIDQNSKNQIDNLAEILKAYPDIKVLLRGHTDNTGSAEGNTKLSDSRAFAVKGELVRRGVEGSRISTKGMGSDAPIADNATPEGRAKNRRIDISIVE